MPRRRRPARASPRPSRARACGARCARRRRIRRPANAGWKRLRGCARPANRSRARSGANACGARPARRRRIRRNAKRASRKPRRSARRSAKRARTRRAKNIGPVYGSNAASSARRHSVLAGARATEQLPAGAVAVAVIIAGMRLFFFAFAFAFVGAAGAADVPRKTHSIEGITEWQLANGLKLLTIPDPGADTVTVHIVYLVGSRHEGYGEKGMAHLLEHLLFRGSKRHPNVKEEFTRRGGRWNGTTSNDRTNYFTTLAATGDNLEWAIAMEADRMLNSFVRKEDLDSEMTVVRNEFEMGENNPGGVLFQRMQQLAYPWHNYGNPIIGQRSDIERVPIDKLQAFYKTWYQPDNALLIVAGRFEEAHAVSLVAKHFGPLPRPKRVLPAYYTDEPTQDGERRVRLERVGDNHIVMALYRASAGSHPDFPAIDVLANILGDVPAGRLHRGIVQKGLAASAWGAAREMHDPGYLYFGASLGREANPAEARE